MSIFYTNSEAAVIDYLYDLCAAKQIDGLVMNPTSWADSVSAPLEHCIKAIRVPYIEIHETTVGDPSTLAKLAIGVIHGFDDVECYLIGLGALHRKLLQGADNCHTVPH